MMDLDNLKHINDTYGHDWGDQYIHRTGLCHGREHPRRARWCARLSGDEFMLLFYGYLNREQIREKVRILSRRHAARAVAVLPGGSELRISISGGMAWYPEDSRDMETLKKYADFAHVSGQALPQGLPAGVQHGKLPQGSPDRTAAAGLPAAAYRGTGVLCVPAHLLGPRSAGCMAYEALMRSDMERLRSPATIMKLAREQGALQEIERLTFFKSLEDL